MTGVKPTIGVLGGMGPEATVLFMQKMIEAVGAADDADHIPLLVDSNTQIPSRIRAIIEGRGDDPGPVLGDMARRLEQAGADALAMPCNTAHHFAPQIQSATSLPFLNMLDLSAAEARILAGQGARIGVLGSPALEMTGVFEAPFDDHGLVPVYAQRQDEMLAIIRDIKARGVTGATRSRLQRAADELFARGADAVMVCCTEYSLAASHIRCAAPVFDTLDVLVAACVRFSMEQTDQGSEIQSTAAARGSSAAPVQRSTDHEGKETVRC